MTLAYLAFLAGFILIFLRQVIKGKQKYSLALWIPQLWLILFTTRIIQIFFPMGVGRTGVPSIESTLEGNPLSRNIAIALIIAGLVVYLKRKDQILDLFRANKGILILYAYILLSITWADYPDVSLKRFIRLSGVLLMALIVASERDHQSALEEVFRRYLAVHLPLSLFFIKTDRSIGYVIGVHGEHFMAGIGSHKNDLGVVCMLAVIFLLAKALRRWPSIDFIDGILISIAMYLLIRARSMTALVLALVGVALVVGMKLARGNLKTISLLGLVIMIAALPALIIAMNSPANVISGAFFSATGKDATLSGRIPMWRDLIGIGKKEIIQGSGYESFWAKHYNEIWATWTFLPTNAHSGYVEVLLNLGLIGLAILIGVIVKLVIFLGSRNRIKLAFAQWHFIVLIVILVNNVTESSLLKQSLAWCIFLMILMNSGKDNLLRQPLMEVPFNDNSL